MGLTSNMFGRFIKPRTELFKPPTPPSQRAILYAENALGMKFPPSFIKFMNAGRDMQIPLCGSFYWVGVCGMNDILNANKQEHERSSSPLAPFLVAFYNDGMGNQICFDTRTCSVDGEYSIVFWDHELTAEENLKVVSKPSNNIENAGKVASSFPEWFDKMNQCNAQDLPEKS